MEGHILHIAEVVALCIVGGVFLIVGIIHGIGYIRYVWSKR
jgi:hypothetical protein